MKRIKILHITDLHLRHNGRLFYNTGKRLNNGLVRLNHSVLEFSDRDIVSYYRNLNDLDGSKKLNNKLIEVISNYKPSRDLFRVNDVVIEDYIESANSTIKRDKLMEGYNLLKYED